MLKFSKDIQDQFVRAELDDFSPAGALTKSFGGPNSTVDLGWREAVIEFLCVSMEAGLITPLNSMGGYGNRTPQEVKDLLRFGDAKNNLDQNLLWNVMHFDGTRKLTDLLSRFELVGWEKIKCDLSVPFGKALRDMRVVSF